MPTLQPTTTGATSPVVPSTATLAHDATGAEGTPVLLSSGDTGIPARILVAYHEAADIIATEKPACRLPWELLAAIGKVESGHAAGHPISPDGTITRPILGPPLNGTAGVALIHDTDHGALDHDTTYDRAVGPMQFIPTTWTGSGRDGNGDGRRDPHNIYDATLAAAFYLCGHGRDLTDPDQLRAAIRAYNPSDAYVRTVLAWMRGCQSSTTADATGLSSEGASADDPTPADEPPMSVAPVPSASPSPTAAPSGQPEPSPASTSPPIIEPGVDIPIITLTPRSPDASTTPPVPQTASPSASPQPADPLPSTATPEPSSTGQPSTTPSSSPADVSRDTR
ncbi:hypothetical protein CcI49_28110 [Frankia sp. CcI49]|uniref:lytic transglycosylase domain-containing protein n=1 Tax=Frankia sp. CcI49 TaxID=1745382 RepID=UPI0009C4803B|nr:lytic murein transglycosylase [Frankia sp. CcI49]ONH55404.1 hypothetical protein CcI49_28110 [Frankia sp. CcI49]